LAFPDVLPGTPLHHLMIELHQLHARAGRPSLSEVVARQDRDRDVRDHFTRDAVHRLFSKTREAPPLPLLYEVVRILAEMAPKVDVEVTLDRIDQLWLAADRYETLRLGLSDERPVDGSELECSPSVEARGDQDE
jgi:hypothetical protein